MTPSERLREPLRLLFLLGWLGLLLATWKGHWEAVDELLWDRLQRKLPAPTPALSLTLVGLDDATLEAVGAPSLPRDRWARALGDLHRLGARAIVLDVFFQGERDPAGDQALAAALEETRCVVPFELSTGRFLVEGRLQRRVQAQRPAPSLRVPGHRQGFANLPVSQSRGGVYRRVWLVRDLEGDRAPSLGLRVAQDLGLDWGGEANQLVRLDFRPLRPQTAVERVGLLELLEGRVRAEQVRDRVVFLGATSPRLGDIKDSPLGQIPGALVHATVLENLAGGRLVRQPGFPAAFSLLLPALGLAWKAPPALWLLGALGAFLATLLLTVLGALLGVFLPAGAGAVGAAWLGALGLFEVLRPPPAPEAPRWDLDSLRAHLRERLLEEDLRGMRLTLREVPVNLREEDSIRLLHARSLIGEGREGILEKVLEGHGSWEVPWEERRDLARALEAEGLLELALEQWEWLYRKHAARPGVSDALFRLRQQRDGRWGVLSPRAIRDLLGWRFRNLSPLAEGGEALLFTGEDKESGRAVVIKLLHPRHLQDAAALERFCNEARALGELGPDQVPELLGQERGRLPYLVLGRCPGEAPVPGTHECRPAWLSELVTTLLRIHRAGWVHRDLHPGNLLVHEERVTLLDFGLACRRDEVGPSGGTPGFVAPEQARGEPAKPGQDLFALGATVRVLAGEGASWAGEEIWQRCLSEDPGDRPGPEELEAYFLPIPS